MLSRHVGLVLGTCAYKDIPTVLVNKLTVDLPWTVHQYRRSFLYCARKLGSVVTGQSVFALPEKAPPQWQWVAFQTAAALDDNRAYSQQAHNQDLSFGGLRIRAARITGVGRCKIYYLPTVMWFYINRHYQKLTNVQMGRCGVDLSEVNYCGQTLHIHLLHIKP
jgi:hypothetical protein